MWLPFYKNNDDIEDDIQLKRLRESLRRLHLHNRLKSKNCTKCTRKKKLY